jgi:hypothetical protein
MTRISGQISTWQSPNPSAGRRVRRLAQIYAGRQGRGYRRAYRKSDDEFILQGGLEEIPGEDNR